jgi:hypothetical protein
MSADSSFESILIANLKRSITAYCLLAVQFKVIRCKIRGGRASPFLAAWRELKTIKMWIPMGASLSEIIHTTAKTIKIMKECHKRLCLISRIFL